MPTIGITPVTEWMPPMNVWKVGSATLLPAESRAMLAALESGFSVLFIVSNSLEKFMNV